MMGIVYPLGAIKGEKGPKGGPPVDEHAARVKNTAMNENAAATAKAKADLTKEKQGLAGENAVPTWPQGVRVYKYTTSKYLFASLGPVILMTVILAGAIVNFIQNPDNLFYQYIIILVSVVLFFEVVGLNNPAKITDDGEKIRFHGFGRAHEFRWADLDYLNVRRFPLTSKVLLRIGRNNFMRGRYWFFPKEMSNGDELMQKLTYWQQRLHPEKAQQPGPGKREKVRTAK